ncbi:YhgE/Pip domain-containing protein [Paenibacillus sp. GCM10028914]|uniref:YhgE/Pip domain-containing protein n=1 Tax=Paenibacillus sp. GCM10028914 TaxID=3273416 RepID=UPI00361B8648
MKNFLTLLKNGSVIGGIVMIVFYQIAFIAIFMSGYSAIPRNMDALSIAIVNEDVEAGKQIAEQLQKELPFKIVTDLSLDQAKEDLNNRDIHMVLHIPNDFSQKLSEQGEHPNLDFLINQSNPAMVTSTMDQISSQITNSLNQQFAVQGAEGIMLKLNMPEDQAKELAADIPSKVTPNVVYSNPVPAGMHNQMAPFFLTMVSYVGAMIFSMMVVGAMNMVKGKMGVWPAFWSAQGVNALVSLLAPLIGLTIYFLIQGGYGAETFVKVWLLHSLELFAAIEFMSIFSILLKDKAIFANLSLMLIQTISSGAVLTYGMMDGFYKFFSHISIMYYTIQTEFSILFGGGKIGENLTGLIIIAVVSTVIASLSFKFISPDIKNNDKTISTAS